MSKKEAIIRHHFWSEPAGYFVSAVLLLGVGYILFSLAVDSGSILQWVGTITAVLWGFGRLLQGIKHAVFRNGKK